MAWVCSVIDYPDSRERNRRYSSKTPNPPQDLSIVLAYRKEDIERLEPFLLGHDAVLHVPRNAIHVPLVHQLLFRADVEDRLALEDHADLLVRVLVLQDRRERLHFHVREHHFVGGARGD